MSEEELFAKVNEITPELAFVESEISRIKKQLKELEERKSDLSKVCVEAFEKADIGTYENDKIKITFVAPSVRFSIDKDALKEKYPEIADEFTKETDVKASIRIKVKENK